MFVPVIAHPAAIAGMTEKQLNETIGCMCDKQVQLKDIMAVWTCKHGSQEYEWFPCCDFRCYTRHITEGNT
jgi:hypothetical protein